MDPELKALLEENHRLVQENNQILRSMRRNGRIGIAMKIIFWAIILGAPLFLWHLYFPGNGKEGILDVTTDLESFQGLLKTYEGLQTQ